MTGGWRSCGCFGSSSRRSRSDRTVPETTAAETGDCDCRSLATESALVDHGFEELKAKVPPDRGHWPGAAWRAGGQGKRSTSVCYNRTHLCYCEVHSKPSSGSRSSRRRPTPRFSASAGLDPPRLRPSHATVLTGVRRCGKSTLQAAVDAQARAGPCTRASKTRASSASARTTSPRSSSVLGEIAGATAPVFLDEVQEAADWPRLVRALLDQGRVTCVHGLERVAARA